MASNRRAGKGCGSQPTGEKCPRNGPASGAPPYVGCPIWRDFHDHSVKNSHLRVALVDSDPCTHHSVREALKVHARGWTLDSHLSPDSLLAALDRPPAATPAPSAGSGFYQQSTLPTINPPPTAPPHVVVMEARWPGVSGIDHLRALIARRPQPRLFTPHAGFPLCACLASSLG